MIGASNDTAKMGGLYFRHALESFEGAVYPVTRRGGVVQGVDAYPSLAELPVVPDVAFVAVPAEAAVAVTKEAADIGVRVVVIHSGGFAEAGEGGAALEEELVMYARARGTRIVGPNSMGSFGGQTAANLLGLPHLAPGGVSFISASGTLIQSLAPRLRMLGLGYRNVVGFENQADIEVHEYLEHCADDDGTDVVLLYLEGIKNKSGRRFVDALRRTASIKPVLVLRGAQTSSGQRSAVSHTAAMISPASVYTGLLQQSGVVELEDESDIVPFVEALSVVPRARSRRIAVLGEGGGFATLAADAVEREGLSVPAFSSSVQAELRGLVGDLAGVGNPVDAVMVDQRDGAVWGDIVRASLRDGTGAVLRFGLFQDESEPREFESVAAEARSLGAIVREVGVPVVVFSPEGDADPERAALFQVEGVPVVRSMRLAARLLAVLARHLPVDEPITSVTERGAPSSGVLSEAEGLEVLARLGLPVPRHTTRSMREMLDDSPLNLGFESGTLVLKAIVPGVNHKSDIGGVRTGLVGEDAIRAAAIAMAEAIETTTTHRVTGFIIMEQVSATGPEVLLSAHRDDAIGPLITVGTGGVLAEADRDIVTFAAPVTRAEAETMLRSLSIAPLLDGFRGSPPVDVRGLADAIARFSLAFVDDTDLHEVEINPVMTAEDGCWAVDAVVQREENHQ